MRISITGHTASAYTPWYRNSWRQQVQEKRVRNRITKVARFLACARFQSPVCVPCDAWASNPPPRTLWSDCCLSLVRSFVSRPTLPLFSTDDCGLLPLAGTRDCGSNQLDPSNRHSLQKPRASQNMGRFCPHEAYQFDPTEPFINTRWRECNPREDWDDWTELVLCFPQPMHKIQKFMTHSTKGFYVRKTQRNAGE